MIVDLLRHRGFTGSISYIPEGMKLRGECFGMPEDNPIIVYADNIDDLRKAFASAIDLRQGMAMYRPKGMTVEEETDAIRKARMALRLHSNDHNLAWFVAHQPHLVTLYDGMYIVVQNSRVIATFPDAETAESWINSHLPDEGCSCFQCIPGIFAYTKEV